MLALGPLDLWPVQNTSSFDLRPGATEVTPWHRPFIKITAKSVRFPGPMAPLHKGNPTRLFKAVGTPLTPIFNEDCGEPTASLVQPGQGRVAVSS